LRPSLASVRGGPEERVVEKAAAARELFLLHFLRVLLLPTQ
jgi:hypothetical protein